MYDLIILSSAIIALVYLNLPESDAEDVPKSFNNAVYVQDVHNKFQRLVSQV